MEFRRDRLTWLAYAVLAWFAYLQTAPGLIVPHLRDELHIGYTTGGLHLAAWAAGSIVAGLTATAWERRAGRRSVFWVSSVVLVVGITGLTAGQTPAETIGALFVAGWGGGTLLITIQALLADHHGEQRAVALTEANVFAAFAYLAVAGMLSLTAALGAGWRAALLVSFLVPLIAYAKDRDIAIATPPPQVHEEAGGLGGAFRIAMAMMFCTVAAEWCITAWGASFVQEAADVSADTAVGLMFGYFSGVVIGRATGSRLARRYSPHLLLAVALAVAAAGFAILWPAASLFQALAGLTVMGAGLGNLFPLALSVTVGLAPTRSHLASGRAVMVGSAAVLLAPLTIGALADATSITAALAVEPAALALAAAGLTFVTRARASLSTA